MNPVTRSVFHLAVFDGDLHIGDGTGFLEYDSGDQWWLITCRHVVVDADHLRLSVPKRVSREITPPRYDYEDFSVEVPLVDATGAPLWLEHPKGAVVDVVAVPVRNDLLQLETKDESESLYFHSLGLIRSSPYDAPRLRVGADLFVVGFPYGQLDLFPIWKRATVATEPALNFGGAPRFLVDTVTRPGMSGSPVVSIFHPSPEDEKYVRQRPGVRLEGVYSARLREHDELGQLLDDDEDSLILAQLGLVWKKPVIDEIFWAHADALPHNES